MPSLRQFIRVHDQLQTRQGGLVSNAADIARDWSQWASRNKEMNGAMGELMHTATIGGVDLSRPYEPKFSDEAKASDAAKAAHDANGVELHRRLKEIYNKQLDDKGRAIFNTVRDHYVQQRQDIYNALESRINESGASESSKQELVAALKEKFEAGRQAVYFPLSRRGDFWASAKDKDGNTISFSRFEKRSDQATWLESMREKGFTVDQGDKRASDDRSVASRLDPNFVAKVASMAHDVSPELADEIWQTYLRDLPSGSLRKQFMHRVGRLGYSMDAMQAFTSNGMSGARQIQRLEYGHRLESALEDVRSRPAKVAVGLCRQPKRCAAEESRGKAALVRR